VEVGDREDGWHYMEEEAEGMPPSPGIERGGRAKGLTSHGPWDRQGWTEER
jgi:hypothetical protein